MPSLAQLTDAYAQPDTGLPVEPLYVPNKEDAISVRPVVDDRPEPMPEIAGNLDEPTFSKGTKIGNKLFGLNGEERYQTWPEKVLREGLSAAGDVMANGTLPPGLRREDFTDIPAPQMPTQDSTWLGNALGIAPVAASPADSLIDKAQAMSALAGTGGLAGADATLGSAPFLRPALKYENKIYKAPLNGQHLDALPSHLAEEFNRQAMSGEDISNFNFGFMNHKGQFLDRQAALDYAIKEGLVDPHAGQYGALTSTLLADSSKPGTAIEAMAKSGRKIKLQPVEHDPFVPLSPEAIEHYAKRVAGPIWEKMTAEQRTEFMSKPIKGYSMNDYHAEMQGYMPEDWYHGSSRSDRLTEKGAINPKRATSGPMPFFSNDPEMASAYAMGKKGDTSLMKHDPGDNVANYFTVSPKDLGHTHGRTPYTVEQSWHFLKPEVKADILDKYHRIGYENRDTSEGPYTLHNEPYSGLSGKDHYDWVLKHESTGNPLTALRNIWHDGGNLIGNETDLAEIYKLAGYPHKISEANAPWTEARGVMPAKLRIQRPLVTDNKEEILNKVIPHLEQVFKNDRSRVKQFGADMWDKETKWTPKEWVKQLKEDTLKGDNGYTWTSIPDKITNALKQLGYDGIIDTGGKGGGAGHKVAIPFTPDQVRSKYAKFDPVDIGKSGLLKSDNEAGAGIAAMKQAQPFYSALEHNVDKITQSKMTGDQWLGTLANKPGVKPEELQWTGTQDFLKERGNQPVTKGELQEHLQGNKVELKEVNKGKNADTLKQQQDLDVKIRDLSNWPDDPAKAKNPADQAKLDAMSKEWDRLESNLGDTKYHGYQLAGGENYREMLLTLPKERQWIDGSPVTKEDLADPFTRASADRVASFKDTPYQSSHWDEPNILAHVRMNDRVMSEQGYSVQNVKSGNKSQVFASEAEAKAYQAKLPATVQTKIVSDTLPKKSLHLEEIQSDWHQQGRDRGYKNPNVEKQIAALDKERDGLVSKYGKSTFEQALIDRFPSEPTAAKELKDFVDKLDTLRQVKDASGNTVPDAPFKKSWHELALKRMIREAAEKGYDRLSWTPGEAQAARYDLSKSINKLSYNPKQQYIKAWDHSGKEVIAKDSVKPEDLPGIVGKEAAQKLLDQKPKDFDRLPSVKREDLKVTQDDHQYIVTNKDKREVKVGKGTVGSEAEALAYSERYLNSEAFKINNNREIEYGRLGPTHILEGQDLKIGGEGMKGFYDQIIPKALEKIGKEHGVKVKSGVIRGHQYKGYDSYEAGQGPTGGNAVFGIKANGEKVLINQSYNNMDSAIAAAKDLNLGGGANKIHYIDIPQSLRDTAMHKGFPLFSGGYQFIPVVGNPFEDKKK